MFIDSDNLKQSESAEKENGFLNDGMCEIKCWNEKKQMGQIALPRLLITLVRIFMGAKPQKKWFAYSRERNPKRNGSRINGSETPIGV